MSDYYWILTISIFIAIISAILSIFITLQKKALLIDALSHSTLLGVVFGYLIFQVRYGIEIKIAAFITVIVFFYLLKKMTDHKINTDSAIGIIFSSMFSLAILLISKYARDIDLDCVIFGELLITPYNTIQINSLIIPEILFYLILYFAALILILSFFARRMFLSYFDINFSCFTKFSKRTEAVIIILVSIYLGIIFDAVGVILPLGLLTIPANIAVLFSNNLTKMISISIISALIPTFLANYLGSIYDIAIAPTIILMLGIEFILAIIWKYK